MPNEETRRALSPSHSAVNYCAAKLKEAVELHTYHPTEDNLLRVADIGRIALNVGHSLSREAGYDGKPFMAIYTEAVDYCRLRWPGSKIPELPKTDRVRLDLLCDKVDELQREVREIRDAVAAKKAKLQAVRRAA